MKKGNKKLLQYAAMAGTFLAASSSSDAQIVYTDVDPDLTIGVSGMLTVDMDNDGNDEFEIAVSSSVSTTTFYGSTITATSKSVGIASVTPGASVAYNIETTTLAGTTFTYNVVAANDSGDIVSNALNFETNAYFCFEVDAGIGGSFAFGEFAGVGEKFAGVRFDVSGNTHYGWIRVEVGSACNSIKLIDYAYEATPNTMIVAGDTGMGAISADTSSALWLSDVSDDMSGLDMRAQFNKAADETTVAEYRLIVVKTADAPGFTLADAEAVAAPNYFSVMPVGSNIDRVLTPTSTDKDGDLIVEGVPYRAFVLNMAGGVATVNTLSGVSNELILSSLSGIGDPALLAGIDVYSFGKNIFVKSSLSEPKAGQLKVYSMDGKLMKSFDYLGGNAQFNLDDLSGGTYLTKLDLQGAQISGKVVID